MLNRAWRNPDICTAGSQPRLWAADCAAILAEVPPIVFMDAIVFRQFSAANDGGISHHESQPERKDTNRLRSVRMRARNLAFCAE